MAATPPTSLEVQLRKLAPFSACRDSPTLGTGLSDSVAIETVPDATGLNAGGVSRVFILRPESYEVLVVTPSSSSPPLSLLCSPAPLFPLTRLRLSPDASLLALYGPQGAICICVSGLRGDVGSAVTRRPAVLLDLSAAVSSSLTQLKWMGGGQAVLLTSDNSVHLRQLILDSGERVNARHCSPGRGGLSLKAAPSREEQALREFVVDVASAASTCGDSAVGTELFFLMGTGDVYWSGPARRQALGPLRWCPATADNYGCDFCALECIEAGPLRLLILATTAGRLYHCLVVRRAEESVPVLLTYDAIDLDLGLPAALSLRPDPLLPTRYFVLHPTGVHVVHLPWLPVLRQLYTSSHASSDIPQAASVVEHALCLQPRSGRDSPPLVGFALVGPVSAMELLCVAGEGEIFRCRVRLTVTTPAYEDDQAKTKEGKVRERSVLEEMERILRHDDFPPLLVRGLEAGGAEMVHKMADALRKQYLERFESARALLKPRIELLEARRAAHANQLLVLEKEHKEAGRELEKCLTRIDEASERGDRLREKLYRISDRGAKLFPRVSREEERIREDGQRLGKRLEVLKRLLDRTVEKEEFCSRIVSEEKRKGRGEGSRIAGMQASLVRNVRPVLKEEGDRIGELIEQLQGLQTKVQTKTLTETSD